MAPGQTKEQENLKITIIESNNKRMPRFRFFAALSLIGLVFSALFVIVLKKYHIYEYEYEFGRNLTVVIFVGSVIVPLAYYALKLFEEKVFRPLLHKICHRRRQRRIDKYGHKKVSLEERYKQRITKVLSTPLLCQVLIWYLCVFSLVFLVLGVRRLQLPEGIPDNDTITIFLMILSIVAGGFVSLIIGIRIFKKKNGVKKTLKYAVGLKKQPGILGRFWLKVSGINSNDIQSYLSETKK